MQNELLWIALLAVSYIGILFAYRFFGKAGLYVWTAMAVILANIQVLKTVQLFGFVTALGNIIYGSTFLISDILNENHSEKDAKKAVWIGFFILIATTIIMQLSLSFIPDESDFITPALQDIFGFLPRIAVASLTAYLISQHFDVWFYNKIKRWTKEKHLWLRNNLSTMVSQLIDNVIFTWIAFIGLFELFGWQQVFDWPIILSIFLTTIVMKYIVAILDTPFLYLARKLR
jgi:hypothetical protein